MKSMLNYNPNFSYHIFSDPKVFFFNDQMTWWMIPAPSSANWHLEQSIVLESTNFQFTLIENHHLGDWSHLTLKIASTHIVEASVTNNSPSRDSNHPDDHFLTPGFKPFSYRFHYFFLETMLILGHNSHANMVLRTSICTWHKLACLRRIQLV